ncbi:MAG: carboxypeptidase-like regulatory domain-containing protein [Salinivirgaceae bacterium]|nr:carboxypeptidase-like regulatory domain-containing protein [Salinivirgaceae bacterium]
MLYKYLILISFLFFVNNVFTQIKVSGFVKDIKTGELLIGAHVVDRNSNSATATDLNGYFAIICSNSSLIKCSFIGYNEFEKSYSFKNDTVIELLLKSGSEINEITVKATRTATFNVSSLSIKELNVLPSLSAKPDVLKSAQFLPGIKSQSEGSSMLIVRGGNPGQNLYLLDETPILYVNHLGGFMSVFNPDMINNISIYKGGFPPEYGGKLSSIINITQRSGNQDFIKGSFSIGLTDASFSVEGPIGENVSFIVTGRKTLFDALLYGASKLSDGGEYTIMYGFHDINSKLVWKPNTKNTIQLNLYQGDDYLAYWSKQNEFNNDKKASQSNIWGNVLLSTKWNRIINPSVFTTNSLSYTRYRNKSKYLIKDASVPIKNKYLSSVQNFAFKNEWNYKVSKPWTLKVGLQNSWFIHNPQSHIVSSDTINYKNSTNQALENALFFSSQVNIFNNSRVDIGLRVVNYNTKQLSNIWVEPRINITMGLNSNHKLNVSFTKMSQNSHLLFTNGSFMSNETWIPATKQISSAVSYQSSIGWRGYFFDGMYNTELIAYYKNMKNLATYKNGYYNLKNENNWENRVESGGVGTAKGVEFLIKKNNGEWTGSLAYCFSNATRQFKNINNGNQYLYEYDRPHTATIIVNKKITAKLNLNIAWVFQSGLPYTQVIGRHYTPAINFHDHPERFYYEALVYGERNSARMLNYHRLDVALNYEIKTKKHGNKAVWTFGVYNLYNRHNSSYYYYNSNKTAEIHRPEMGNAFQQLSLYQISLFPIMPSVSYKVYFGVIKDNKNKPKDSVGTKLRKILYFENKHTP